MLQDYRFLLRFLLVFFILSFLFSQCTTQKAFASTTWATTTIDSTGSVGGYTSMVLGADGFPRVSYYDSTNGDLKFMQCTSVDCSTKVITTVDSTNNVGKYTSIAMGSDGFARISYQDVTGTHLKYARCTNADCSTHTITTIDSLDSTYSTSIAIASDGFPRIAYVDGTNNTVDYVTCASDDCSSGFTTSSPGPGVSLDVSMMLGSDDFGRIVYYDQTGGAFKFIRCTNSTCTTKNINTIETGVDAEEPSVKLGTDGFGRVSYFDSANGSLHFAQCTNTDCSTSVVTTLDNSNSDVGRYTSLAMASDGFARISYYDGRNDSLKYAVCTSADCSSHTISQLDASGNVGLFTSLALTSTDLARISYLDFTNNTLKLAVESPVTSPVSSSHLDNLSSVSSPPRCGDAAPTNAPDLFQLKANGSSVTLYFVPVSGPNNEYYISYGLTPDAMGFGTQFNYSDTSGVIPYTVNDLFPATWYLKVRGGNGCATGAWSQVLSVKILPFGGSSSNKVLGASTTAGKCTNYTVQAGDSLWKIASLQLGSGFNFQSIMQSNGLNSSLIHTGQTLKVGC